MTHQSTSKFVSGILVLTAFGLIGESTIKTKQHAMRARIIARTQTYRHAQSVLDSHTYCGHYVVCGGVHSLAAFQHVLKTDQTVKDLYSKLGNAKITKTDRAMFAYDSYRVGNKIYWTKKPRFIPAGELIITDGALAILMRCGNLISLMPQTPVEDIPVPDDVYPPDLTPIPPYSEPLLPTPDIDYPFVPPVTDGAFPTLPVDSPVPDFQTPFAPCCSIGAPKVVSTPEPGMFIMLLTGLLGLAIFLKARKQDQVHCDLQIRLKGEIQ